MTFDCYEDTLKPFLLHFWTLISVRGKIAIFDRVGTPENHKTFQEDKI